MAKQTIASSNMLPWHSCHWVRTTAYQTAAPFIKNVARASRWLYCEDALHRRFEAGHSAPTEIHGRLPPSPYRPRRHMGGGRSPVLQAEARDARISSRCNAPSDDLRPSGEDPSRIAVIIDEAHSGIPDDGAFIKNVANVGKKGSRRPLERIYPFWLGCPSPISSARC